MPAHRSINQHVKRDRLPSNERLQAASGPIQAWWDTAYSQSDVLPQRFVQEARASLPGLKEEVQGAHGADRSSSLSGVFAALQLQQLRLRHDQQVPEWSS
ncbi:hypothetical protein [Lichenicola sp.]|uniref:hypothetical protein n=1 Tax=Lichenicola sp. TaxID=2804529 RepID=UPI003AFFFDEB